MKKTVVVIILLLIITLKVIKIVLELVVIV